MIRVLLVDDHAFVRSAVSQLLSQTPGIEVVGECQDGAEVPRVAGSTNPDVVLMDVQMPEVGGVDATRTLLADLPQVRVLMLAGAATADVVSEAARAGAVGFFLKGGDPQLLVSGIRTVAAGGTLWNGDAANLLSTVNFGSADVAPSGFAPSGLEPTRFPEQGFPEQGFPDRGF